MLVIGLTGSIGMGKSTAAARLRHHGLAVFDADAEVHTLYSGPLANDIEAAFPGTAADGRVDRTKLTAALLAAPHRFKDLEAIVHPRVRLEQRAFLKRHHESGARCAVLEIPLLFESGADKLCDATIVVSADAAIQRARVLARPGMSAAKLNELLARQMPDEDKRARANFIVDTSGEVAACDAQVDAIIVQIDQLPARAYQRFWS